MTNTTTSPRRTLTAALITSRAFKIARGTAGFTTTGRPLISDQMEQAAQAEAQVVLAAWARQGVR